MNFCGSCNKLTGWSRCFGCGISSCRRCWCADSVYTAGLWQLPVRPCIKCAEEILGGP